MRVPRCFIPGVLLLSGCAALHTPEGKPPPPPAEVQEAEPAPVVAEPLPPPREIAPVQPAPAPPEIKRLLEYFRSLKKLAGADLAREHENVRSAFARTRSDYDRLRLALVMSLPDTAFNDESRALELLEPMTRNQQSTLNDLALLIHAYVHEQRRLEQSLQGAQEKLDALKAMERTLIQREKAGQIRR